MNSQRKLSGGWVSIEYMPIAAANVTVDVCGEHGVWFDRDELQRVVQAVAPQAQRTTPVPMAPQQVGAPPPPPPMAAPMVQPPMAAPPMGAPMMQPPTGGPMAPGMAPGQYVAPGWFDESAQKPFGGMPSFGSPVGQQQGAPPMPGQPGAEQGGWGVGKTALAVGGGLAAVAGVAYVASHTNLGRQAMGMGQHQSGFGAVGDVLSKLF